MTGSPDHVTRAHQAVEALVAGVYERVTVDGGAVVSGWIDGLIGLLAADVASSLQGSSGSSAPGSRSPAFTPALDALMALSITAADLAAVTGATRRDAVEDTLRGVIGRLGESPPHVQRHAARTLAEHVATARVVLGIDLPPVALRGVPCPYCGGRGLLASRRTSRVWCTDPACVDGEGRRHVWDGEDALRRLGGAVQSA